MLPVVGWIILLSVCVVVAGWWFMRRQRAARRGMDESSGQAHGMAFAEFSATSPLADADADADADVAADLQGHQLQVLQASVGSTEGRSSGHPPVDRWFEDASEPAPVKQALPPQGLTAAAHKTIDLSSTSDVRQPDADADGLKVLGRYLIDKPLGCGSMGAVYLAHDPVSGRANAIKTMALGREFSGPDLIDARNRFLREADMAGRLQHPDIVQILDAGESGDLLWIAMELIDGTDLGQHTQPDLLLPLPVVLRTVARVADALAYAHTRGVTHRDIKPENIMLDLPRDSVKVMDFGVARLADASRTRTGVILGTPTYMSPEQLSGQHVDGRTDLYSLGVTLFQLLTARLPAQATSLGALMRAIARETPPNVCDVRPDLPAELGDIVALALQKHPATRYKSGEQMAEDLRAVLKMLPEAGAREFDITLS